MEQREDKFWCTQAQMNTQSVNFEQNSEISVPDYLGEISRLLRVWPRVLPPRRFISGGNAEFSGRVCYDVLYAGADGKLYHTDMEDTYTFSVPLQGEGAEPCAFLVPDVVVGRVIAPRRLAVRCRVQAQVGEYRSKPVGVTLSPEEQEQVCVLGDAVECGRHFATVSDTLELQESFDTHLKAPQVIFARGEVFLPEVTATHDGIRCRGEVVVSLLCCEEGEQAKETGGSLPVAVTRSLPFTTLLPLEGVCGEDMARAVGTVEELRTTVEGNRISLSVGAVLQAEAAGHETVPFVKDLFLPHMQSECRTTPQKNWVPTVCKNQNYSLSATPTLSEIGLPSGAIAVDVCADAEIGERSADAGQVSIRGSVHCHLLYHAGEEWGVGEAKIPFCVAFEGEAEAFSVLASVPLCRVQQEQGIVRLMPELVVSILGGASVSFAPVQEVCFSPVQNDGACDLEFYYPAKGETLWEISRRFALPPEALANANGLESSALCDPNVWGQTRYLMLPSEV
ncbi:MAG: LysM peptidoglycan-binding domain-containing protein [Clostridia bacterium]|nr:LysM peptidoglycan-binding domain-containing protein [Clostridia bacterium]